ncbi:MULTISPECIES: nucleoside-diphosphate sugar epimerase/dehydratase [Pseudonocardia]|uniref:UDP-N-acetyl-alpha-D-glucosamine C6 dehydratase n=2 Tax=Pseudonocardia TaxID=1847 RepID=A0A1Y2N895_PSEAH|nr:MULTISPECIES: nucleoside-diphosphate sugar epimerase/dehydratase [Pseudonocardia]OSY43664.1 UDP-N-acetyl-alpha-D-glucosamine C6 dehydratase [Pseudonocardia autotrophica]TDN73346.1 FlaA1/EpsC-like NDP-sugar epimerase [Pseudonocardia autotrophica]BBG04084.1 dTDP-glucose 4,6-dehydratase [Pseudonocardia autotrophica]GEC26221.1 dTDP-glucose 4,6-dehydratase [Pseudonocardia saturnea]
MRRWTSDVTRTSGHNITFGGIIDALTWTPALAVAAWLRLDGELWTVVTPSELVVAFAVAFAIQMAVSRLVDRLRGRQVMGAVDDALHVVCSFSVTGTTLFAIGLIPPVTIPRSLPLIALLVAVPLAVGQRVGRRLLHERRSRPDPASSAKVIVFGAGWGGQQIVRSMLGEPGSGYLPVSLVDDDPQVRARRISGVPVSGTRSDIPEIATRTGAEFLVIAIRDLEVEDMREISRIATGAGLQVKVIPALREMFRPWIGFSDLQDLDIADLIGRTPVEVDLTSIADYVAGRCVLVTGAGGSIGSELCRQLNQYGPASLLMLDRDESALHALQLSIHGRALLDSPDVILADIRDADTLLHLFQERRPDVVFHAAALKHLPMLEQYPEEAWQTNVVGTANVLAAARATDVSRFVNISTDKAANPTSVLGYSKRLGERLIAGAAQTAAGTYVSVRFGNVLGSRGSVLTTFAEQIGSGQPVTITHPDVTRFFMTIPEAVRLVIQAGAVGRPGEALVLDMGDPVRIVDIARQLTVLAGRSVQIVYTGLRDGEKLHEELFGDDEQDVRPVHPAVSHVPVPPLYDDVRTMTIRPGQAGAAMRAFVDGDTVLNVPGGRAGSDDILAAVISIGDRR